jgi:hypothetical protein
MKISIYAAPDDKERFETVRQHSILHPERIVGNSSFIRLRKNVKFGLRNTRVLGAHLHGGAKAAASRWPSVTPQVILAFVASRFLCFATKSSDPQ